MNQEKLKFILQEGEGQFIEFKESFDKKIAQEIVAFANAEGGKVFIGITDKSEIMDTFKIIRYLASFDNIISISAADLIYHVRTFVLPCF